MTEMRVEQTRKFGRGGARSAAGRPPGGKNLVPRRGTVSDADLITELRKRLGEALKRVEVLENELGYGRVLPSTWDSKRILEAQAHGEIYASPQQLYAAAKLLPIEYAPAIAVDSATPDAGGNIFLSEAYNEFERRALKVLRKHPEALQDWLDEFRDVARVVVIDVSE
jgi:hypothetical protein